MAGRIDRSKKHHFQLCYFISREKHVTRPFQHCNGTQVSLLHKNTRWLRQSVTLRANEIFEETRLTITDVGDDKIPYLDGPRAIRTHSQKPAMESSRKWSAWICKARLCHRMYALSIDINVNVDQYNHRDNTHSPKNSKVIELFTATETVCGEKKLPCNPTATWLRKKKDFNICGCHLFRNTN